MPSPAALPFTSSVASTTTAQPGALSAEPAWQLRAALAGLRAQFL
ncbi:hypothetical protein CLU86_2164 [Acidovorax sp. 62]|nr:hypothetical protein [Acidovorax sp. 62]PIF91249.1 hypothetical protein CLU86_2164 [Acidovorax sp. 62]